MPKFKEGKSGNPKGRPKSGTTWKDVYEKISKERLMVDGDRVTKKKLVARKVFKLAFDGVPWAVREVEIGRAHV